MANAMRKLGVYLGLVEDSTMGPYDEYGYQEPEPKLRPVAEPSQSRSDFDYGYEAAPSAVATAEVSAIHTIHPRSYNDAKRVGEEYRAGHPVILNLTEMSDADAKRIVDFSAGLVFAMRGSIDRVTLKVFLLSPPNVNVMDAPAVQQARDGFFNQS